MKNQNKTIEEYLSLVRLQHYIANSSGNPTNRDGVLILLRLLNWDDDANKEFITILEGVLDSLPWPEQQFLDLIMLIQEFPYKILYFGQQISGIRKDKSIPGPFLTDCDRLIRKIIIKQGGDGFRDFRDVPLVL